jgi:hypothetical protein
MAGEDASGGWYMRARGRVSGPFSWAQLQSLRDRGQLARFHQLSQDRQTWISADGLARLFPNPAAAFAPGSDAIGLVGGARAASADDVIFLDDAGAAHPMGATSGEASGWFFAHEGSRHGPLPVAELKRLIDHREIGPETLFWKSGMDDWTPGFLVPELMSPAPAGAPTTTTGGVTLPPPPPDHRRTRAHSAQRTSPLAFASLVLGLLWLCGIGSAAAVVLGLLAARQIDRSNRALSGTSLATAGVVLGVAGLIATLAGVLAREFLLKLLP